MFNTDLNKVSVLLLPLSLRKEKWIAWLKVFVSQIKILKAEFVAYREEKLFFIAHNSQVIYLEHILNYRFNTSGNDHDGNYEGNGIYIEDGAAADEVYIYNNSELGDDTFLFNNSEAPQIETYISNNSETQAYIGFVIWIPITFNININEVKALVNRLKLAGKSYVIKRYSI